MKILGGFHSSHGGISCGSLNVATTGWVLIWKGRISPLRISTSKVRYFAPYSDVTMVLHLLSITQSTGRNIALAFIITGNGCNACGQGQFPLSRTVYIYLIWITISALSVLRVECCYFFWW